MGTATVAAAGLLGFGLLVAHNVADHWAQTDAQARDKGLPGWPGRVACAAHVTSYTAILLGFTSALVLLFRLPVSFWGISLGLLVSAVSHYWADRRFTLARLCEATGRGNFYRLGQPRAGQNDNPSLGTGAYALDQSWHWFWVFVTTIVMVVL